MEWNVNIRLKEYGYLTTDCDGCSARTFGSMISFSATFWVRQCSQEPFHATQIRPTGWTRTTQACLGVGRLFRNMGIDPSPCVHIHSIAKPNQIQTLAYSLCMVKSATHRRKNHDTQDAKVQSVYLKKGNSLSYLHQYQHQVHDHIAARRQNPITLLHLQPTLSSLPRRHHCLSLQLLPPSTFIVNHLETQSTFQPLHLQLKSIRCTSSPPSSSSPSSPSSPFSQPQQPHAPSTSPQEMPGIVPIRRDRRFGAGLGFIIHALGKNLRVGPMCCRGISRG